MLPDLRTAGCQLMVRMQIYLTIVISEPPPLTISHVIPMEYSLCSCVLNKHYGTQGAENKLLPFEPEPIPGLECLATSLIEPGRRPKYRYLVCFMLGKKRSNAVRIGLHVQSKGRRAKSSCRFCSNAREKDRAERVRLQTRYDHEPYSMCITDTALKTQHGRAPVG